MATREKSELPDTNGALDSVLRDHFRQELRGVTPSSRLLMSVLQRAQTEVEQLPPLPVAPELIDAGYEADTLAEDPVALPPSALLNAEPDAHPPTVNLERQLTAYRYMTDLKLFRTLGAAATSSLSLSS